MGKGFRLGAVGVKDERVGGECPQYISYQCILWLWETRPQQCQQRVKAGCFLDFSPDRDKAHSELFWKTSSEFVEPVHPLTGRGVNELPLSALAPPGHSLPKGVKPLYPWLKCPSNPQRMPSLELLQDPRRSSLVLTRIPTATTASGVNLP